MADCNNNQKPGMLSAPRRNHYFYGKLLDESSLQMEQDYFNQKRMMLNRLGLGSGVLCGLNVSIRDKKVCIEAGAAIDAQGREIIVPQPVLIDPWQTTDDAGRPGSVPRLGWGRACDALPRPVPRAHPG